MFATSQQPPDRGQTTGVRNPFLPFGVANQTLISLVSNVLNDVQPVSVNWPEQDCIFADVGEYLVKCSEVLAQTAEKLVNHNHLMYQLHQSQQQQQWSRESFGYGNSFYLAHKHESLKNLSAHLRANSENLRVEWSKSEHPPQSHHQHASQRNPPGMASGYGQEHPQQHHQQQHHQQQQQQHQQHQHQQHQQHHLRLPTMAPTAVPVSSVVSAPASSQQQQQQQQHQQQHQQTPVSAGLGPASATAAGPVTTLPRLNTPNTSFSSQSQYGQPQAQQPPQPQPPQQQQQQQQTQTPVSYSSEPVYPLSSTAAAGQMEPMDDEISALDEERVRHLLSQPQHRGVGQHYCPLHDRCDKGGVAADGTIRLFERNSDFRTHLKKHVKMYKCPVPGCKNVEGFGRKDQLERHIRTTKHGPSAGTGQSQPQAGPQLTAPPVEFRY